MKGKIILEGRPITKKNSSVVTFGKGKKGKPRILPSKQYRRYEKDCLWQLKAYKNLKFGDKYVKVEAIYWMPNRRGWPDLIGLEQATADILEKARIIDDDKYIVHWGDSHIAGIDKKNPRVEILITEMKDFKYQEVS